MQSPEALVGSVLNQLMSIGKLMRRPIAGDVVEPGTFWFLRHLAASEAMRMTDLATVSGLDASTVSRHIAQLHRQGLVERTADPLDGRVQRVMLSVAGQQCLNDALQRRHDLLAHSFADWDPADIAQLDRLLGRFVGTAQEIATRESSTSPLATELVHQ